MAENIDNSQSEDLDKNTDPATSEKKDQSSYPSNATKSKMSKYEKRSLLLSTIAIFVAFTTTALSLILNYCQSQKYNKLAQINTDMKVEALCNEAWDLMGGSKGEPKEGTVYIYLGKNQIPNKRQLELAKRKIKEAKALDPKNPKVIKLNADLLDHLGKREQAVKEFQKAIDLGPKYVGAINNKGMCLFRLGRLDEAYKEFEKARELEPENAVLYVNQGFVRYEQSEPEEAFTLFKESLKLDENFSKAHEGLGLVYMRKGYKSYALASAVDPKNWTRC